MITKNENIRKIFNTKWKEMSIKDMLEQKYEPMIELNRQLEMIVEDGDWGEDTRTDIEKRINILCNLWYTYIQTEREIGKENNNDKLFKLHIKLNKLDAIMHNLMDYGTDENNLLSEIDKMWVIKLAKEEVKRITFDE